MAGSSRDQIGANGSPGPARLAFDDFRPVFARAAKHPPGMPKIRQPARDGLRDARVCRLQRSCDMKTNTRIRSTSRGLVYGAGFAAGACAAYVGVSWLRYGHAPAATGDARDPLLDRFMPAYDVVDRYQAAVAAP